MPPRPVAYVAAPYAAEHPAIRTWNVERATLLARVLVADGLAPLLVHRNISPLFGEVETPDTRAIGLSCDFPLVEVVARSTSGVFAALLRNDGTPSPGMADEFRVWQRARQLTGTELRGPGVRAATWDGWAQLARRVGLEREWGALVDPSWISTPDPTPQHGGFRSQRSWLGPRPADVPPEMFADSRPRR